MAKEKEVTLTESRVKAAHRAGCEDVKKVLDNLFPDLFKKKEVPFVEYGYYYFEEYNIIARLIDNQEYGKDTKYALVHVFPAEKSECSAINGFCTHDAIEKRLQQGGIYYLPKFKHETPNVDLEEIG